MSLPFPTMRRRSKSFIRANAVFLAFSILPMIPLPSKPKIVEESSTRGVFEIEGLYPGYGHTIGNALRRVLLSSLKGAAIVSIKIDGTKHEFSTIEGVMEDAVEILLNLKQMRFKLQGEGPYTIKLDVSGDHDVKGSDFEVPSQVEVMTLDQHIATLTSKKAKFFIEAVVESGRGYVPAEARSKEKVEVGTIALDAAFSPVQHANYEVENMRVGDRTDYHRVRLVLETDGSITPREAFLSASEILVDQFGALVTGFGDGKVTPKVAVRVAEEEMERAFADEGEDDEIGKTKLDELKISSRTLNALREAGIKTVGGISRKREPALREIAGIGEKGIQEIKKALGGLGIVLKA